MSRSVNWIQELNQTKLLQDALTVFLDQYGFSGLEQALTLYSNMQSEYICKTKTTISKIKICDIYYLQIKAHTITIYTRYGSYQKYGSLTEEQRLLSPYGFMKCNQSCIVSLEKIMSIHHNSITLINNVQLHMSQHYAPNILMEFLRGNNSKKC
ncbi:MAG: LytTR family transcriptional regulator [Dorea sp.]|jgi:DNA-binding LytR/AlgR family response regulator|nr:LytTR family transcriptional regulator [Dorea sp.]